MSEPTPTVWPRSYDEQAPLPRCRRCDGEGVVPVWRNAALTTCDDCAGTGADNGRNVVAE